MRKAIARGRVFPQSYSTDRRIGRLSLKAWALFPLLWVNADDQGRLSGDPEEIKYACCPNIDHITKADIPALLDELSNNRLIKAYNTSKTTAIQLLDWWEEELKLQWASPSRYPPPDGWIDHIRYHQTPTQIVTENWPPSERLPSKLPSPLPNALPSATAKKKVTKKRETDKDKETGEGNLPSALGSRPPPSPADLSKDRNLIINKLMESFRFEFGRVPAESPGEIIPREPTARERAQIRDLAQELVAGGGCLLNDIREAFREAAGQEKKSKRSISYVRGILLPWLGRSKERSPP